MMGRLRDYLELSRVSNLPTCWSNVLTGAAIGATSTGVAIDWQRAGMVALGVSLMYVAGMAINDAVDAPSDARDRPQRPIPSGRISRRAAVAYGIWCLALGLATTCLSGHGAILPAMALAVCIVLYDILHRRLAASVVLMGVCRGLIYLAAAGAVGPPPEWRVATVMAVCLGAYIVTLTIIARREAGGSAGKRRWLALALGLIALVPILEVQPATWRWSILGAAVLVVWVGRGAVYTLATPPRIGPAVAVWLSGICLIDGMYLTLLDHPALALGATVCFVATLAGHRVVAGT